MIIEISVDDKQKYRSSIHIKIKPEFNFVRDEHIFMPVSVLFLSTRQHLKTTYFSIDFSIEQTVYIQNIVRN